MNRASLALVGALAAILLVAARPAPGATGRFTPVEWLVAKGVDTSMPQPAPGSRIDILIQRWSSDQDRASLGAAFGGGPGRLVTALQHVRRPVGMVQFPGHQGLGARARARRARSILFARDVTTPTGRRIVLATDQYPDFGRPARVDRPIEPEFVLIDIRLGSDGRGVGKVASGSDVAYDQATGTLYIRTYDTQPVRLADVRSQAR